MDPMFLVAILVTIVYALVKFGEYKFLQKDDEKTPLKDIFRELIIVSLCSLGASYIYFHFQGSINEFFNVVTDAKVLNQANTQVFTDKPNF
jgi:flagellar biosynthesis regulator FlbT|tara:strand:- start:182 stop:454 length:273 start_codon:yes stop_codon:yes gene_type:complete